MRSTQIAKEPRPRLSLHGGGGGSFVRGPWRLWEALGGRGSNRVHPPLRSVTPAAASAGSGSAWAPRTASPAHGVRTADAALTATARAEAPSRKPAKRQ